MSLASVIISGRDWFIPGALFIGAAFVLLVWSYGQAPVSGGRRWLCFALKLLGVLALAACLLEPLWSRERARPGANFFAVVADNSQGMNIKDRGATRTRGQNLQALLAGDNLSWTPLLEENFQ